MQSLAGKKILLGISGGIAAYKCAELTRRLVERGATVQVVMTHAAKEFITPLTMQAVSGRPVSDSLLDPAAEASMGHIELAKWADLVLLARRLPISSRAWPQAWAMICSPRSFWPPAHQSRLRQP